MKMNKKKQSSGFTLIEALIAAMLLGLVVAALAAASGAFTMANGYGVDLTTAEFLIEEAKVALVPGIAFGADNNQRLSFATSMENLQEGMDRIESALKTLHA